MKTSDIVKSNNKALEQRFLQSINESPKLVIEPSRVHDSAFNKPITLNSHKVETLIKNQ